MRITVHDFFITADCGAALEKGIVEAIYKKAKYCNISRKQQENIKPLDTFQDALTGHT